MKRAVIDLKEGNNNRLNKTCVRLSRVTTQQISCCSYYCKSPVISPVCVCLLIKVLIVQCEQYKHLVSRCAVARKSRPDRKEVKKGP